jgi:hypothetical protein
MLRDSEFSTVNNPISENLKSNDTGAADGPGAFSQGFDPFQQAVCNYNWDWMAAT